MMLPAMAPAGVRLEEGLDEGEGQDEEGNGEPEPEIDSAEVVLVT
jgi:hypothetical protein